MCHFNSGSDWEDPDDPMVIAETELNSAAITIDAAAKKLANLKPRKSIHHVSKGLTYFCVDYQLCVAYFQLLQNL